MNVVKLSLEMRNSVQFSYLPQLKLENDVMQHVRDSSVSNSEISTVTVITTITVVLRDSKFKIVHRLVVFKFHTTKSQHQSTT